MKGQAPECPGALRVETFFREARTELHEHAVKDDPTEHDRNGGDGSHGAHRGPIGRRESKPIPDEVKGPGDRESAGERRLPASDPRPRHPDAEARDPSHDEMTEQAYELHWEGENVRLREQVEKIQRLLESHSETDDGAIDEAVHGIVELAGEDRGDPKHHRQTGELLLEGRKRGKPPCGLRETQRQELNGANETHGDGAEDDGEQNHVPGLALVEIVAIDEQHRQESRKKERDVERHVPVWTIPGW